MTRWTVLFPLALAACGTMNTARALRPGEQAIGVTLGGPIITSPVPTPIPNLVVEGKVGLPLLAGRAEDVRFGTDLTALAFGTLALHAGWTWQIVDPLGARPAFAVTNQVFFASNFMDWTKGPSVEVLVDAAGGPTEWWLLEDAHHGLSDVGIPEMGFTAYARRIDAFLATTPCGGP